jgi:hypothetical protein
MHPKSVLVYTKGKTYQKFEAHQGPYFFYFFFRLSSGFDPKCVKTPVVSGALVL